MSNSLDYAEFMFIQITKVKPDGVFTHWESAIYDNDLKIVSECTGPTYIGVMDTALAYIYDEYSAWVEEDAKELG